MLLCKQKQHFENPARALYLEQYVSEGRSTDYAEKKKNEFLELKNLKDMVEAQNLPSKDTLNWKSKESAYEAKEEDDRGILQVLKEQFPEAKMDNKDLVRISFSHMMNEVNKPSSTGKIADLNILEKGDKIYVEKGVLKIERKPSSRYENISVTLYPWTSQKSPQSNSSPKAPGTKPKPAPEETTDPSETETPEPILTDPIEEPDTGISSQPDTSSSDDTGISSQPDTSSSDDTEISSQPDTSSSDDTGTPNTGGTETGAADTGGAVADSASPEDPAEPLILPEGFDEASMSALTLSLSALRGDYKPSVVDGPQGSKVLQIESSLHPEVKFMLTPHMEGSTLTYYATLEDGSILTKNSSLAECGKKAVGEIYFRGYIKKVLEFYKDYTPEEGHESTPFRVEEGSLYFADNGWDNEVGGLMNGPEWTPPTNTHTLDDVAAQLNKKWDETRNPLKADSAPKPEPAPAPEAPAVPEPVTEPEPQPTPAPAAPEAPAPAPETPAEPTPTDTPPDEPEDEEKTAEEYESSVKTELQNWNQNHSTKVKEMGLAPGEKYSWSLLSSQLSKQKIDKILEKTIALGVDVSKLSNLSFVIAPNLSWESDDFVYENGGIKKAVINTSMASDEAAAGLKKAIETLK